MASFEHWDRCCNPLKLLDHKHSKGLRRVSESLHKKWGLSQNNMLCANCRLRMSKAQPSACPDYREAIEENIDHEPLLDAAHDPQQDSVADEMPNINEAISVQPEVDVHVATDSSQLGKNN